MFATLFKVILVIAVIIAIPIGWWQSLEYLEGNRAIAIASGVSLFALGFAYRMLGSFDAIPDWIPLLGRLDDSFAWVAMLIGVAVGVVGYLWL